MNAILLSHAFVQSVDGVDLQILGRILLLFGSAASPRRFRPLRRLALGVIILLKCPGFFLDDSLCLLLLIARGMEKGGVHFHGVGGRTLFVSLLGAVSSSVLSFPILGLLLGQLDPLLDGHMVDAVCVLSQSEVFLFKHQRRLLGILGPQRTIRILRPLRRSRARDCLTLSYQNAAVACSGDQMTLLCQQVLLHEPQVILRRLESDLRQDSRGALRIERTVGVQHGLGV